MKTKHGSFQVVAASALILMVLPSLTKARAPAPPPRSARNALRHVVRGLSLVDAEKTPDEDIVPDVFAKLAVDFIASMAELLNVPFECPVGFGIFRDPVDCATYYECKRGNYTEHKCEKDLGFDEMKGECLSRDAVGCMLGPLDEEHKCKISGLEPYPPDCTKYYFCVGTRGFIKSCRPGKKFDEEYKMCVHENHAKCAKPPA